MPVGLLDLVFLSRFLQTHKLEPSGHYLRLKVWNAGQTLFYVPKLEEDISDVVRKHTHLSKTATNHSTATSDDRLTFLFCLEFFYMTLLNNTGTGWK